MGFREGAFATVWEVKSKGDSFSKIRVSTSRKDKKTDDYVTDFSGFVSLIGKANEKIGLIEKALKDGDRCRIKMGACDVSNRYDKKEDREFTNFTMFDFEMADGTPAPKDEPAKKTATKKNTKAAASPLSDDEEEEDDDANLPF